MTLQLPVLNLFYTFTIVCVSWVFFRATNVGEAFQFLQNMLIPTAAGITNVVKPYQLLVMVSMLGSMLFFEIIPHFKFFKKYIWQHRAVRWSFYYLLILMLFTFGRTGDAEFIYFQF